MRYTEEQIAMALRHRHHGPSRERQRHKPHGRGDERGIGRQTLSNLANEKVPVPIRRAYPLSKAFGSIPDTWLRMQLTVGLAWSRRFQRSYMAQPGQPLAPMRCLTSCN